MKINCLRKYLHCDKFPLNEFAGLSIDSKIIE